MAQSGRHRVRFKQVPLGSEPGAPCSPQLIRLAAGYGSWVTSERGDHGSSPVRRHSMAGAEEGRQRSILFDLFLHFLPLLRDN